MSLTSSETLSRPGTRLAGNTATGTLKMIALVLMLTDHAGKMLFPNIPEMRLIGRLAFPIYVWCLIVGFEYTRNAVRYMLRLLLVGLISQPLYMVALNHTWKQPNIFLTLLIGLAGLWGIREKRWLSHLWAPAAAVILAGVLGADYGWKGVLFIFLLYAVRGSRAGIAAVMISYFLFWGYYYSQVTAIFGIPLSYGSLPEPFRGILSALFRTETFGLLALPLILIPFGSIRKMPLWLSYIIYPAHLALLWLLETLFR
ncbi:MAG: hypothetical protein J6U01_01970 [Clostridia bacterium]|nr:hypothetical protein [Clostridia bacterium]